MGGTCNEEKLGLILSLSTVTPLRLSDANHFLRTVIGNSPKLLHYSKVVLLNKDSSSCDMCHVLKWVLSLSSWAGAQPIMNVSPTSYVHVVSPLTQIGLGEWHSRLLCIWESATINAWPLNVLSVLPFTELSSGYMQTEDWVWQHARCRMLYKAAFQLKENMVVSTQDVCCGGHLQDTLGTIRECCLIF